MKPRTVSLGANGCFFYVNEFSDSLWEVSVMYDTLLPLFVEIRDTKRGVSMSAIGNVFLNPHQAHCVIVQGRNGFLKGSCLSNDMERELRELAVQLKRDIENEDLRE